MATKTSLIINAVNEGKTLQKAIADVNPSATTAELKAFAQGMLGLTDYTYTHGALVERTELEGTTILPHPAITFWLGDTQLEITGTTSTKSVNFSLEELKANPNVTNENNRLKFNIEIRGALTSDDRLTSIPVWNLGSGVLMTHDQANKIQQYDAKAYVDYYLDINGSNYNQLCYIRFDVPDTMPASVSSGGRYSMCRLASFQTRVTRSWFFEFWANS